MKEIAFSLLGNPVFVLATLGNIVMIFLIIRSWISKKQKPIRLIRVSWFLWFVMDVAILVDKNMKHSSTEDMSLVIAYTIGAFLIFLLSIPYGVWVKEKSDEPWYKQYVSEITISIAVIAAAIFYVVGESHWVSLILSIALFLSAYPTFMRVWKEPWQEPFLPWMLWFLSSTIGLFYIDNWTFLGAVVGITYFAMGVIVIIPLVRLIFDKKFLKKSEIITHFSFFVDTKHSPKRLTLVAKNLGLIKDNEELREIYQNPSSKERSIRKEKTKEYCYSLVREIRDTFGIWDDDEGFVFQSSVLENIVNLLKDGKYFSAKDHFLWESDKLINQKKLYVFLVKKFKN